MKEIPCGYCGGTGWVCESHPYNEFEKCGCGGAGKPCVCNKAKPPWNFKAKNFPKREIFGIVLPIKEQKMKTRKLKIWFASGDFILGALVVACAWGKLSWFWFWLAEAIEIIASINFNNEELP
jgi:hypothetical protein